MTTPSSHGRRAPLRLGALGVLLMATSLAQAATVSASRPNLTDSTAANYTVAKYLQRAGTIGSLTSDNWSPTAGVGNVAGFTAKYTVASDGTGTHTTVQAAINAASGSSRVYIAVKPGTYRAVVCVPSGKPPITLYSTNADASKTVLVYNNYAGKSKGSSTAANACNPNTGSTTYGTTGSASFTVSAANFQAKNLTFSNDYSESGTNNIQAVALMTMGDKLVFENVRVLGNQDTLFVSTGGYQNVARSYFKNSHIQGDVDFIFGRGTAVFDGCKVQYLSGRHGNNGNHIAPATAAGNTYGFLFINSHFARDTNTGSNVIELGRSWDEGVSTGAYRAGTSPNGQAVIRESTLDSHITLQKPWGASTSGRAFSSSGNRLREYKNTGAGS